MRAMKTMIDVKSDGDGDNEDGDGEGDGDDDEAHLLGSSLNICSKGFLQCAGSLDRWAVSLGWPKYYWPVPFISFALKPAWIRGDGKWHLGLVKDISMWLPLFSSSTTAFLHIGAIGSIRRHSMQRGWQWR